MTIEELRALMEGREDEHVEFKEAKSGSDSNRLADYCLALANERGGRLVLGITDKCPRRIVGSNACRNTSGTKTSLYAALHFRVEIDEIIAPEGRVLVFTVPSRPAGRPLARDGRFLMRNGEELTGMSPEVYDRIRDETRTDFSAEICRRASFVDLDPEAIARFRNMWAARSGKAAIARLPDEQLLRDAELVTDEGITHAALILLGTRQALGKCLGNAEVIYEYRLNESDVERASRRDFREGFLTFFDELWTLIDARNTVTPYQVGFVKRDIPVFQEEVVREAILNAVAHREYRSQSSISIRQYPRVLEIVSPGGFPTGVTPENILRRQVPRNRRIAEAIGKCGLVERAGQGVDIMFRACIRDSKPLPDYAGTDDWQVMLTLRGEVQDPQFIRFLEVVAEEQQRQFDTEDLLVLDLVNREQSVPRDLKERLHQLEGSGVVERLGRGARYILSQRLYKFIGKGGVYTRRRGLDRETNKELLLRHIQRSGREGSRLGELMQVLPSLTRSRIQVLLRELRNEGSVHSVGRTSAGRWYPGSTQ